MNLSPEKKKELFEELLKSKAFSKPTTSTSLLKYLFDATEKGTNLKESVIESEFFGDELSDEKSAKVRVNVYNLRKKLATHYETEGKDSAYQLIIEKGQYEVKFIKSNSSTYFNNKINIPNYFSIISLGVAILLLFITNWPAQKPDLWRSLLDKEKHTTLYIGDFFGFSGTTVTGKFGWTRDFSINSMEEFYAFCDEQPAFKETHNPADYSYTTAMASIATQKLQSLFQTYKQTFSIRFSTKTSISEIKSGNSIYVGPIKNNNPFIHFFNEGNPYFNITGQELQLHNHPLLNDTVFFLSSIAVENEYTIVSKIPGPNNTDQFIFFSDHGLGIESTIEYFTDTNTSKKFTKKYLKEHDYFTTIFYASGKDRTNTKQEEILTVSFDGAK